MSQIDNLINKFEQLENYVEETRENASKLKGRIDSKKEDYQQMKAELAEEGFTFSSGAELKQLFQEKTQRMETLLNNAYEQAGLSETDEDDDEFDLL